MHHNRVIFRPNPLINFLFFLFWGRICGNNLDGDFAQHFLIKKHSGKYKGKKPQLFYWVLKIKITGMLTPMLQGRYNPTIRQGGAGSINFRAGFWDKLTLFTGPNPRTGCKSGPFLGLLILDTPK